MKRQSSYRMAMVWLGVVVAILMGAGRADAGYTWTQEANMPTPRYQRSTSVVGGKIYAIGGWNAIGEWNPQWDALTRVDVYDPRTDTWTRKADMPTARGYVSTCVVNEKIYVMGGDATSRPISIVEVYDPATDTWAEQTELPTKRWWFSTSVVDGIIYVIGGNTNWTHLRTVEAYDPVTDTWTTKADMPTARSAPSSCVVGGKIYVIGGAMAGKANVEAYDPTTNTWTVKAPMPTARYLLGTSLVSGKICAIGGYYHSINGPIYSTVEVYDPQTDTWLKGVDIPIATAGMSTSVLDGRIYVMGGTLATHAGEHWVLTSAVYAGETIVDFNGDGKVDEKDLVVVTQHWGQNYPRCDVAPMPCGDRVVDAQDLMLVMESIEGPGFVLNPRPHAIEVPRDAILTWTSPKFAPTQDVYFGTSFDDVNSADRGDPRGVLVSQGQTATAYCPAGLLEYSRTYYWRIDFVVPGPTGAIYKGAVLDFTTEAFAYPVQKVTATASSALPNMGPEKTVDGSGLDKNDGHSTDVKDTWQSTLVPPHWIQYQFDKVYALHELWVWNSNSTAEPFLGFGAKSVKIEYSTDGTAWTPLANVSEFARAPGQPGYKPNTIVSFGGVWAKFVKLTIEKGWGTTPSVGLSEVRFFHIPDRSAPKP